MIISDRTLDNFQNNGVEFIYLSIKATTFNNYPTYEYNIIADILFLKIAIKIDL